MNGVQVSGTIDALDTGTLIELVPGYRARTVARRTRRGLPESHPAAPGFAEYQSKTSRVNRLFEVRRT